MSIDVVIPNYNYGRYLGDCLASVLGQDVAGLRVLVIDNASTDNSAAIAREWAARDARIALRLRSQNHGAHASFNEGIDWARSDYFAILCSDDMLAPGALARAIRVMVAAEDVNLVFGRTEFVAADHGKGASTCAGTDACEIATGSAFIEAFCRDGRSLVDGPTAVVRTSAQKRAGYYRPDLPHTDDVEMWMRLACFGRTARLDRVQVLARIHQGNQSAVLSNVHLWNLEMEKAFESFFDREGAALVYANQLRRMARRSLAVRSYWCALSHALRGEPGSLELLIFALTRRPSLAVLPPLGSLLARADAAQRVVATLRAAIARFPVAAWR